MKNLSGFVNFFSLVRIRDENRPKQLYTHIHRVPVADRSASSRTATNVRNEGAAVTISQSCLVVISELKMTTALV